MTHRPVRITQRSLDEGVIFDGDDPTRKFAEASTLGIPPGTIPRMIDCEVWNKQPLLLTGRDEHGTLTYLQQFGRITLSVFND